MGKTAFAEALVGKGASMLTARWRRSLSPGRSATAAGIACCCSMRRRRAGDSVEAALAGLFEVGPAGLSATNVNSYQVWAHRVPMVITATLGPARWPGCRRWAPAGAARAPSSWMCGRSSGWRRPQRSLSPALGKVSFLRPTLLVYASFCMLHIAIRRLLIGGSRAGGADEVANEALLFFGTAQGVEQLL